MRAYNIRRDLTSRMLEGGREDRRQAAATACPTIKPQKNSDFGKASALMFVPEIHVVGQPFPVAVPNNAAETELAAWTQVCRVILNLHETITRY